jgi:hypothetical protein
MSSKKLTLWRLLSQYNSFEWDIARAWVNSGATQIELRTFIVENDIDVSSRTIIRYGDLYNRLKKEGYSDDVIDRRPPSRWLTFISKNKIGGGNAPE